MRSRQSVASMMFCLVLAACASGPLQIYEGPALPDSETALIIAPPRSSDRLAANIRILSADDRLGEVVPVTSRSIRVTPRGVCIEARATTSTLDSFSTELCFNAYANIRYEVRAEVTGFSSAGRTVQVGDIFDDTQPVSSAQTGPYNVSRLFVLDMSTRMIVASVRP